MPVVPQTYERSIFLDMGAQSRRSFRCDNVRFEIGESMTGLAMMLKSFGIKIDPAEVESAFNQAKSAIPQIAQQFAEMNARQERMEKMLHKLMEERCATGLTQ